jgi:WD40 repeat protein
LLGLLLVLLFVALVVGTRPAPSGPLNGLIVFVQVEQAGGPGIVHVMNPDGSGDHVVRPEPHDRAFWSPDGTLLGFNDGYANADGTDYHPADLTFGTLLASCWDWSPDGASCLAGGGDVSLPRRSGVYLLSALERTDPVQITRLVPLTPHRDVPGDFSPDGRRAAFVRTADHDVLGTLMVVGVDGSGERQVASAPVAQGISWAPDGQSILASSEGRLVRIDVTTGDMTPVPTGSLAGADVLEGDFSPDGSRILVRRLEASGTADLYVMDTDGGHVTRLTQTDVDETYADWGTHPIDR